MNQLVQFVDQEMIICINGSLRRNELGSLHQEDLKPDEVTLR